MSPIAFKTQHELELLLCGLRNAFDDQGLAAPTNPKFQADPPTLFAVRYQENSPHPETGEPTTFVEWMEGDSLTQAWASDGKSLIRKPLS